MSEDKPFISLDKHGNAPVLSYSVPDSTSYAGRFYIRLNSPDDWFNPPPPAPPGRGTVGTIDPSLSVGAVVDELLVPGGPTMLALDAGTLATADPTTPQPVLSGDSHLRLTETISRELAGGREPVVFESLYGRKKLAFAPATARRTGQFLVVETYQLSSYLGDYGAGRTLNTFSLLPGEKTKITLRSYTKSKTLSKAASSVFDSFTEESSDAFEDSVKSEQSQKRDSAEALKWHAEASASASFFGAASASVSAGVKGESSAKRQDMAKNVGSATKKHAAKASAKRSVQVNTSSEEELEQGSETSIERTLENVNLNRTLNFVFRQMNQEFITILHLVDIRIGFNAGTRDSYEEVSIAELDELVRRVVQPAKQAEAKAAILAEIEYVVDYQDRYQRVVVERTVPPEPAGAPDFTYHAFDRRLTQSYTSGGNAPDAPGLTIEVPGVILSVEKNTLRTEGVIVEAILGQSDALDDYALGLQRAAVAEKQARADLIAAERDQAHLRAEIIGSGDADRARIYREVSFPHDHDHADEPDPI